MQILYFAEHISVECSIYITPENVKNFELSGSMYVNEIMSWNWFKAWEKRILSAQYVPSP